MPRLGVNVDHIATIREARRTVEPDPVYAALLCEEAGCDSIVMHLREDRRHIKERDLRLAKELLKVRLNLEMSIAPSIVRIALDVKPDQVTFVPEKRKELTTEGGLDVVSLKKRLKDIIRRFEDKEIDVSLFIDPTRTQIEASEALGVKIVELHTGNYAEAYLRHKKTDRELAHLKEAVYLARGLGLVVNAGHGLTYQNARDVAKIPGVYELNIGHSIISKAALVGIKRAVKEMISLVRVKDE